MNNKRLINVKDKIDKLRELIVYHNNLYYNKQPKISDAEYDQLYLELIKLESQYPEYYNENSPTNTVGAKVENTFEEVEHVVPMLSLGKTMNIDEFYDWFKDIASKSVEQLVVECKYDGIACSLKYDNFGRLNICSTRGNGIIGEDVTATVALIPNVPKRLSLSAEIEVRGEILLLKSGLEAINKYRQEMNLKVYENVRNAASGMVRTKQPLKELSKHLRFVPYGIVNSKNNSYVEDINLLKTLGFGFNENPIATHVLNTNSKVTKEDIGKIFDDIQNQRDSLDFDIDGIVCKANLYEDQLRLGNKVNVPNWAIAYKFKSEERLAQILDVEWLLGAKGNVTPRARITPTEIGGTTVVKPTLHNLEELKRLDIKIGDYVILQRRGDVIPKIDRVVKDMRTGSETDITIPTICPVCSEKLTLKKAFLRCDNENCSGRIHSKIRNYVSAVEIEGFGPKVISKLIEDKKIVDLSDIYTLTVDDIKGLERMGDKSAIKLINNIKNSIDTPLWKIITGLTIKNVGAETAKDIANICLTLEGFINVKESDLVGINDIGEITGSNILEWLKVEANIHVVNKLISFGIGMKEQIVKESEGKLNNLTFAFTGALSISREKMKQIIEDNGGTNISIKKGLNYLIIGDKAKDNKIEKAKSNGAIVITEEEFLNMLE